MRPRECQAGMSAHERGVRIRPGEGNQRQTQPGMARQGCGDGAGLRPGQAMDPRVRPAGGACGQGGGSHELGRDREVLGALRVITDRESGQGVMG